MANPRNRILVGSGLMLLAGLMIGHFESSDTLILTAYPDVGQTWTICDGITQGVTPGMTVTPEWCERAREGEIAAHSTVLEQVPYDLPDNIKLAMTDLCYNIGTRACGASTALRRLIAGDQRGACDAILWFHYSRVKRKRVDCSVRSSGCAGIWTRRQLERALCRNALTPAQANELFKGLPLGGLL